MVKGEGWVGEPESPRVVIDIRRRPGWTFAAAAVVIGLGKDELVVELFMFGLMGFENNSLKEAGLRERRRWEGGDVEVGD